MSDQDSFEEMVAEWRKDHPRPRAIICDIDETLCTEFDVAFPFACRILSELDRAISVHYVTSRPEEARSGTLKFLEGHRLPGWDNLHFCPRWKSSRQHKAEAMGQIAHDFDVLFSIGDADEDEEASLQAKIRFIRVSLDYPEGAWEEAASILEELGC